MPRLNAIERTACRMDTLAFFFFSGVSRHDRGRLITIGSSRGFKKTARKFLSSCRRSAKLNFSPADSKMEVKKK